VDITDLGGARRNYVLPLMYFLLTEPHMTEPDQTCQLIAGADRAKVPLFLLHDCGGNEQDRLAVCVAVEGWGGR